MSLLLSLIIVYVLHCHLSNYHFVTKVRDMCGFDWLDNLLFVSQNFVNRYKKIPALVLCILLVVAFVVVVLLLQAIFLYASGFFGLLVFNVAVLLYCLFSGTKKQFSSIFVAAFEHNFAIIFWFVFLGIMGAALYWLFMVGGNQEYVSHSGSENNTVHHVSTKANIVKQLATVNNIGNFLFILHTIAAWIPARLTGLIFSLVGDFEQGFRCWKGVMYNFGMLHADVINRCGEAAIGELTPEKSQILVERSFVVWFVIYVAMIIF
jgi:membrane protein required for beta-lactamase induction